MKFSIDLTINYLSKLTEKVMEIHLKEFLKHNKIIPTIQSGFRQRYICTTDILHVTDDILHATDDVKCTALVLLNYSKVHDTLDHNLKNLFSCGFGVEALSLFESSLTN